MKLILVAHRSRTAFEIRHIAVVLGHDQRALKLARVSCVDAEIRAKLHRAAHAFWYVDERAVAEHSAVQGCEEVVAVRHNRAEILSYQVRMFLYRLTDRAEYDALLGQLLLISSLHRHRVHNGVYGRLAAKDKALFERNAQLVESLHQLGVNLLLALILLLCQRVGII